MSTDGMKDVEVPEYGTVIVQDGEVHDVYEFRPSFYMCWCMDRRHGYNFRKTERPIRPETDSVPHLIGEQQFKLTWEVQK